MHTLDRAQPPVKKRHRQLVPLELVCQEDPLRRVVIFTFACTTHSARLSAAFSAQCALELGRCVVTSVMMVAAVQLLEDTT